VKDRQQFEVEQTRPVTIEEIVRNELYSDNANKKHETYPRPESVEDLLQRIYQRIEEGALKTFRSNELWAIRAWTYEHILTDAASKEACLTDDKMLDELVSPVEEWQAQHFDPLLNFKRKLELSGRKLGTIKEYMRVSTDLVTKYGKKTRYSEAELLEFLAYLRKRYPDKTLPNGDTIPSSTYANVVQQLKIFLNSLPEDDRGRKVKLPIDRMPDMPTQFEQPAFTKEEIDAMCYTAVMDEKPEQVLRFCIACVYGCRVGELAMLSSESINLNHGSPTISIPTEKKGRRKPQPIPTELLTLFSIPLHPRKVYNIERDLRRLCKKAGVPRRHRMGIHSVRRSVVTSLYSDTNLKELSIRRFLRWSESGRDMGVMPRYVKTPVEVTDNDVLKEHPFVQMWKDYVQFLPYLPQYQSYLQLS